MRTTLLSTLFLLPFIGHAQKLPQPSPLGSVEQIVGLTTIRVEYSRPSVRDRKVFGDLVPYGKVWRTGANKCTMLSTDGPLMVEGNPLPAGIYSVFTIPTEDMWTIIFNKDTSLWGDDERKEEADVLLVKVKRDKSETPVETLSIGFADVKDDRANLTLRWENTVVRIGLFADATDQGVTNIKEAIADPNAGYSVFNRSARFCVDRNIMLDSALEWAEKSAGMERKYWNLYTLALARAANGKTMEAIAAAEESMALAQEAKSTDYVRMNKAKIEEWQKQK